MTEIDAIASQLGLDRTKIDQWITDGKLASEEGKADLAAVKNLVEYETLKDEFAEAKKNIKSVRQALNALPDSFKKSPSALETWAPTVAALAAVGVAIWGVCVATGQLESAVKALELQNESLVAQKEAFEAQTKAFHAQTAYTVQSDFLKLYERMSAPFLSDLQLNALLTIYDEHIRIADSFADEAVGALDQEFWKGYSSSICTSWTEALCPGDKSVYPVTLRNQYPGIVSLCFADDLEKNICPIE